MTDVTVPKRLGPKRASKIRKLFNLAKEDDVRQYVIKRPLPKKKGKIDGVSIVPMRRKNSILVVLA